MRTPFNRSSHTSESEPGGGFVQGAPPGRVPKRKRRRIWLKRVLLAGLGLFLLGIVALAIAYAKVSVPQPNDLANAQASILYYNDGKTELARISVVNRESIPLSQIPLHVQHALLAAEDRTFYTNSGISPSGIARSLLVALKGGPTQGGSTITQQYVKNYFLTQDRTVSRKAKEFIISIKIDQRESKARILENYLNTIYYGRGAYGIQTAARAYFGHDASQLTVAEGALLASVIRGPAYYDPALGAAQKASAIQRVNYVLDGMVTQGWLSSADRAKATFPKTVATVKVIKVGTLGYITQEVKLELTNKLGYTTTDIDRGGLRVVTTISKQAQEAAVKAVNDNMPPEYSTVPANDSKALHVGLTAIRPGDGAIVAMYGGRDYSKRQFNTATDATLQGGSTFKVFGLLAGLQKNISTKTQYAGYSPQYFTQFADQPTNPRGMVKNFGNEQFGRIDLRKALADSVNTVFAQLNIALADPGTSAKGVRDAAIAAGLPAACPGSTGSRSCTLGLGANMSNIFGTASPHVKDMAGAFATVAAQGRRATPYLITSVTSASGISGSYKVTKKLTTAFDQNVTADVTDAMQQVVNGGTGSKAQALGRPAAGKTGTSTDNKAVWFDGFTPQLAAAVGIYQGEGKHTINVGQNFGEVTGGTYPTAIWTAFMQGALRGQRVMDFPPRHGVGDNTLAPSPPPSTTATATPVPTTATPTPTPSPTPTPQQTSSPPPTVTATLPNPTGTSTGTQRPPTQPPPPPPT